MKRFSLVCASIAVAFVLSACGSSPTSPLIAGATISGNIVGSAATTGGASAAAPSTGVRITVVGSGQSASVDSNDNFTLTNVPASGNVTLKLTGTGLNTQVALGTIEASEHVSVTISREGPSCSLDSIRRQGQDREELEGRVDGLPPTTAAGTFSIGGQNVQTDANTKFTKGDAPAAFSDLAIGVRVHVKGTPNATGVLAAIVRIQNENADLKVHVEGTVSGFTGDVTAFQFMVNGRLVKGDATTVFDEGAVFTGLVNGVRVEVTGVLKDGFIFATKIEIEADDAPAAAPDATVPL